MKRAFLILCALLCAVCPFGAGHAETQWWTLPPAQWEYAYIQQGDIGPVVADLQALLLVEERDPLTGEALFGEATRSALLDYQWTYGLEETGAFDDLALMYLLGVPEDAAGFDFTVWVPMRGGQKYHLRAECSGMIEPREMCAANAEALGFTPCKRCW